MLSSAQDRSLAATGPARSSSPHPLFVRITHWTNTVAFVSLVVSGAAILLAHPRLYWGETGAFGSPALLTLPLPLDLDQSGWGRGLHFLAAWVCVANGVCYVMGGLGSRHFAWRILAPPVPARDADAYGRLQAAAYLVVIFVLLPLVIVTGLSLSPAVMAAIPVVALFGGHQSARTIHFFVACALVVFLLAHVVMVSRSGFVRRMRRMIAG